MAKQRTKTKAAIKRKKSTSRTNAKGGKRVALKAPSPTPRRPSAARETLAPVVAAVDLYDLVCSVEDVLEQGLTFAVCHAKARAHNKAMPGHDAQPVREQA